MPKNIESNYFDHSFKQNPSLRSYFGSVVRGNSEIYDTPFAKGESTQSLLGRWKNHLQSLTSRWPSLVQFEYDLADKVGPMSVRKPLKQRIPDIDAYYEGILLPSKPVGDTAVAAVLSEWGRMRGLRPRSQVGTVANMKLSTNSGSPYFRRRRMVVGDTIPCQTRLAQDRVYQALSGGTFDACAVLGWRGQEGGPTVDDVKQRVVWMFPFAVNIEELSVYQPLIEAAQRFNIVPAWVGMDAVDKEITALFDSKAEKDLIICTDFSKFDQHFGSAMQTAAFRVLKGILDNSPQSHSWLEFVFPIKYAIPLAYDYGKVRFGKHGMGSGSGGTNCDETIAHRALQYEAAQLRGAYLNPHSMCLGDDGIISYPGCTVDDVVKAYTSHGLEMNTTKQYASTQDCVYLRRWHHKDYRENGICVGVYSTCRALGRLRYLERYMDAGWDSKAVALRQLSILENVKYHPLKEEFVEFCMKRDKYRLGIDIPDFLDDIERIAREKIDLMPDFLGYTKTLQAGSDPASGISSWWIVQYLKSMSK
nr:MAG: RNA-dependent RNA polymerase [Porcine picobirnavirus]